MQKEKDKNDITLSVLMILVGIIILAMIIAIVVVLIRGDKPQEDAETLDTNQQTYNNMPSKNETENSSIEEENNLPTEQTNTPEIQNQNETDNESQQTSSNKALTTEDTNPFKIEGGKIIGGNLQTGVTIEDSNQNQWVWIAVPKSVTKDAITDEQIEAKLEEYVQKDSSGNDLIPSRDGSLDINGEGTGLTNEQYLSKKSAMLQTIKNYGGFYIGKYETGYEKKEEENIRTGSDSFKEYPLTQKPVIKQKANVYNWVSCRQAEKLAESLSTGGKTTSLMFGIQWDLTIKYLNEIGKMNTDLLNKDSSTWGNYSNSGKKTILKTGYPRDILAQGIYDLAGNVWEWTLEKGALSSRPSIVRGGAYDVEGSKYTASYRASVGLNSCNGSIGFRCTLY